MENLPQLQNLIKRDPLSYREEFFRQLRHFSNMLEIIQLNPAEEVGNFGELLMFLAHVSHCFKTELDRFPETIMNILRKQYNIIHPETRRYMVQALMLLKTKKLVDQMELLSICFFLFRCHDKNLRLQLYNYIISDLKFSNQKCKNSKLNKTLQNQMFDIINHGNTAGGDNIASSGESGDIAAKYCLDICTELYRRNIWNDSKTVSIIASACFSNHNKVLVAALKFFLGSDEQKKDGDDSDDGEGDVPDMQKLRFQAVITKKSKSRKSKLERALKTVKKKSKRTEQGESFNFSAIHLVNDPQGMAEKLFLRLNKTSDVNETGAVKVVRELKFEIRLLIINLISRIIGLHKLIILGFYSYLIRYLKPHQSEVTHILAYCAQASHDLVPPETISKLIRVIVDNFVTESFSSEVIACGINSIREICKRCPLSIEKEILAYIVTFKTHRDKGVNVAAKSLIKLYREVNPTVLPKKERGKIATMDIASNRVQELKYGQSKVATGVEGLDLLLNEEGDEGVANDGEGWSSSEFDSEDNEGGNGWIAVSSESELSDIDDIGGTKEKRKLGLRIANSGEKELSDGSVSVQDVSDSDEGDWEEAANNSDFMEMDSDADSKVEEIIDENMEAPDSKAPAKPRIETQRILTPADFSRLKKLREQAEAEHLADGKRKQSSLGDNSEENNTEVVSTDAILGPRKKKKMDREERIASIMEGRKDRPKFGSRKGKERGSITNREKSKRKNMVMMSHKRGVLQKKKMSLRDKQMRLRKHIEHQKKQI